MTTLDLFGAPPRGTADISLCGRYRYRLTRTLTGPGMPLVFVMLNPSVGDASIDDPTIRRCIGFGERARDVADRITARGLPLFCLGTSKDGSPRHPLMLRGDAALTAWRMP